MTTLDLARLRDIRRLTNFAYVIKVEVDHKSKSALAGGNSVNSCNNVVHNRKNCALRIRAVVIGKWGARILTHISRIDARCESGVHNVGKEFLILAGRSRPHRRNHLQHNRRISFGVVGYRLHRNSTR